MRGLCGWDVLWDIFKVYLFSQQNSVVRRDAELCKFQRILDHHQVVVPPELQLCPSELHVTFTADAPTLSSRAFPLLSLACNF